MFGAVLVALVVLVAELLSFAAFWFVQGRPFTYGALDAERNSLLAQGEVAGPDGGGQQALLMKVLHPYIGFVYDQKAGNAEWIKRHGHGINDYGFCDTGSPVRAEDPSKLIIGIVGGSVAQWFALEGADAMIEELKKFPAFQGRQIEVVRMSTGSSKQPQQLMTLSYMLTLGAHFDIVINLDGVNDVVVARGNFEKGIHPSFPHGWPELTGGIQDTTYQGMIGKIVNSRERRSDWARALSGWVPSHSVTLQLIWMVVDRRMAVSIAETAEALEKLKTEPDTSQLRGPGIQDVTRAAYYQQGRDYYPEAAAIWKRSSILLHDICEARGIRYFHFLQPNQYVKESKTMGEEERKIAINPNEKQNVRVGVERGYPELLEMEGDLLAAGVNFHDLRMIFKPVTETVYRDNSCHLNRAGSMIVGRRIATEIIGALNRAREEVVSISFERPSITIHNPFTTSRLKLLGRTKNQQDIDLSSAASDIVFSTADPEIASVNHDGTIAGHSSGTTWLTAKKGELETKAQVMVIWDPVITIGDGVPGTLGRIPRCHTAGERPGLSNPDFTIRIENAMGGAKSVVVLLREKPSLGASTGTLSIPTGTRFEVGTSGPSGRAGVGTATVTVPPTILSAMKGSITYWQAFIEDPRGRDGWSASNILALSIP